MLQSANAENAADEAAIARIDVVLAQNALALMVLKRRVAWRAISG